MFKIICVLRSGGDYDHRYVTALRNAIKKFLSFPHVFYCFSDMPVPGGWIALSKNYPGWWSKIEMFQLEGPVLYIDLDTIILRNIDALAETIVKLPEKQVMMIRPWNGRRASRGEWGSGLMGWNCDLRWIHNEFDYTKRNHEWDQRYIVEKLKKRNITITPIQGYMPGIYSYKHHCRSNGKPPVDARIICFHGKPRPTEVEEPWVKENWA